LYESRGTRPVSTAVFVRRVAGHFAVACSVVLISLGMGMWGYHEFEHLTWLDGFLNAAMLLGGMGPVNAPQTDAGKLFAGLFALYAGLVVIVTAALLLSPVLHRLMHRMHWKE